MPVPQARAWSLASRKPVIQVLATATKAWVAGAATARICSTSRCVTTAERDFGGEASRRSSRGGAGRRQRAVGICRQLRARGRRAADRRGSSRCCRCCAAIRCVARSRRGRPIPGSSTRIRRERPLVEFVLTIPSRVLVSPGEPRPRHAASAGRLLPPRILRRFSKGYAAPHQARTFQAIARTLRDSAASSIW